MFTWLKSQLSGAPALPTLVHISHAKAGSTWINNLLRELFGRRVAPRNLWPVESGEGTAAPARFEAGMIYPAMFMTRAEFLAFPELQDALRFVVIRDLRDTLVSLYFSVKYSHPENAEGSVRRRREILNSLPEDEGLLFLLDRLHHNHQEKRGLPAIQTSWLGDAEIVLRYEDLMANDRALLTELFIDRFHLPVTAAAIEKALSRTRFEAAFKRAPGEEDVKSHGRKGTPGDWKNHFTPDVRRQFADKLGEILILTGYERDHAWAELA